MPVEISAGVKQAIEDLAAAVNDRLRAAEMGAFPAPLLSRPSFWRRLVDAVDTRLFGLRRSAPSNGEDLGI